MKTTITIISLSAILACLTLTAQESPRPAGSGLAERFKQLEADSRRHSIPKSKWFMRKLGLLTLFLSFVGLGFATAAPATTNIYRNLAYDTIPGIATNLLSLDVYTRSDFTNRPVFMYVHGGGWQNGDKSHTATQVCVADDYALNRGYVFVSLNYRLTTTNIVFPAHIQDVARGIAWVYDHIAGYGGDPKQLYLMGHSAGCHLVSLVSCDPRWLGAYGLTPAVLRATIPLDTHAYDLRFFAGADGHLGPTYTDIFGFDPAFWDFSSPRTYVAGGCLIPPMCVCYSSGISGNEAVSRRNAATNFIAALYRWGDSDEVD